MLDKYCESFIKKAEENYRLFEHLINCDDFVEWQIVAIFYSALCYAKAYLYKNGIPINSINSHDNLKYWLSTETKAKQSNVLGYYNNLYRNSRDARYTIKKMTQGRLNNMLLDYKKVKEFFVADFV